LISGETPLQMVIPAADGTYDEIAKNISQEQGLECKAVNILAYAKNVGIAEELIKKHPELLHMQLLANGNVPDNLAPVTFSKVHNLNNIRRRINIATGFVATIGVILAAFYAWQGNEQKEQLQFIMAQTRSQTQQYDDVSKDFPTTPIPSTELKIAAELAQNIKQNDHSPRELMQVLSVALEDSPEISLSRIRWVQTSDKEVKDEDGIAKAEQSQGGQAVASTGLDPTKLIQIGFVNAEIKSFNGDYRAALSTVNKFATRLRENLAVQEVKVLQEPVNVSSFANLQGSTTDETATTERPPAIFKLEIILKTDTQIAGAQS
jgi:hypothetical protein